MKPADDIPTLTRKEMQRAATFREIHDIARALLVEQGSAAVTINAIARRMGMSGPALYRYHPSQAALIEALRREFFNELVAHMRQAASLPHADTPARRLGATCRALRRWALDHSAEFGWLFASPVETKGDAAAPLYDDAASCGAFGEVFLEQVAEIWETQRFPIPNLDDMPPVQVEQLIAFSEKNGNILPPDAAHVFLKCWIRLYGHLCMEVFGQMAFAYTDMEPAFEECLSELCTLLDVPYEPAPA
ncbi:MULTISPECIES: TetR/AcrR family transcriptional regulator [Nitratireductor]|uniref:TetR/AcrR family transcriptional regulator n=1 Tax=Nitratireductor TaxID=245876 RepID=UPI000DDCDF80|nr:MULTISPECIES: TetR/AcrR family transcriptional regulator [Nitratireductor]MDV2967074.1 TetR/AcrR family transcriptional regulator [Nitratireductor aquimarinus]